MAPALALPLFGCKKQEPFDCSDVSRLSPAELELRERVLYKERAPRADMACDVCVQYIPIPGAQCGTCKVMPGPALAGATCRLFVARA